MQAAISDHCEPVQGEDYSGQDLRGQDFSGQVLRCADFSDADLRGARFENAELEYADLDGAIIDESTELGLGYVFVSHQPPASSGSNLFSHTTCSQGEGLFLRSYLDPGRPMGCNNVGLRGIDANAIATNCLRDGSHVDRARDFATMDLSGEDLAGLDLSC